MTPRRCHAPDCRNPLTGRQRLYCSRTCNNRAYLHRKGITLRMVPDDLVPILEAAGDEADLAAIAGLAVAARSRPRERGTRPPTTYVVCEIRKLRGAEEVLVPADDPVEAHDIPSAVRQVALGGGGTWTAVPLAAWRRRFDGDGRRH